jgi:hypothetical protein
VRVTRIPTALLSAVFVLGSSSCATVPRAPDEGGPPWYTAEGPSVVVKTDLGAADAAELVREVERWRRALARVIFPTARAPKRTLEVVVLRNRELEALVYTLRGFFTPRGGAHPLLVLGASETWERSSVMKHELAHAVIHESLPEVPRWLDEGLAGLLETTELDEKSGEVTWGTLPRVAVGYVRNSLSPLEHVLDEDDWTEQQVTRLAYSSRFLVRVLLRDHRDQFSCFIDSLVLDGDELDEAFECLQPSTWIRGYQAEYFEHGEDDLGSTRIEVGESTPADATSKAEKMDAAEVHGVLARVNREAIQFLWKDDPRRRELSAESKRHSERAGQPAE